MGIIALVVSAFEGSVLVRLFTRFTQEIFSALITLIYIVEALMKLFSVYRRNPLLEYYLYDLTPSVILDMFNGTIGVASTINSSNYFNANSSNITNSTMDGATISANGVAFMQNFSSAQLTSTPALLHWTDAADKRINQPNTALFCTFLTLGTFTLAYFLRIFRNSHFLGRTARRALGDFGVPIAIALFVLVDFVVDSVYTEKLHVPEGLKPSDTKQRDWLIPMDGIPVWLPFAAGIPSMLVYILVFMETHISELIVDKPERGLKKGSGLHLDIVLLCFLNIFCGFFGMPWHCAATVRSVTHVSAVTIMSR